MNGLEFLDKIMRLRPLPVIMVSSLTERGAAVTIAAMEIGAVDCVAKPTLEHPDTFATLADKVKAAAGARLSDRAPAQAPAASARVARPRRTAARRRPRYRAASSRSAPPRAASKRWWRSSRNFPRDCAPTVVTMHLPAPFTRSFAQRLDRICAPRVHEAVARRADRCPATSMSRRERTRISKCRAPSNCAACCSEGDPVNGHRPSVDALFHSVARHVGDKAVGVILTGMGGDGAQGLLAMRKAGARTLGQNEATCVVYGMPKVACQIGAVEKQAPLQSIAAEIAALTTRNRD